MITDGRWQMDMPLPGTAEPGDTFQALVGLLGRAATSHATELGLGIRDLHKKGLTWMLSRFLVRVARTPVAGETLVVTTWPSGIARFLALREFLVKDQGGTEVARGTSAWFLIDMSARRPADPEPHIGHLCVHERVVDSLERIDDGVPEDWSQPFDVLPEDIDGNKHVTFSSYIRWVEQALRQTAGGLGPVLGLEINYLAEVFLGEAIHVQGSREASSGGRHLAAVVRPKDGVIAAKAIVRFGK